MIKLSYGTGVVYNKHDFYAYGYANDSSYTEKPKTFMLRIRDGKEEHWWENPNTVVSLTVVSLAAFDTPHKGKIVAALAENGLIQMSGKDGALIEEVGKQDEGFNNLLHANVIKVIGSHIYVAGMNRLVYKRPLVGGDWVHADEGLRVDAKSLEVVGITDIDGYNEADLFAVGYEGEIWHFDGTAWQKEKSPTNRILFGVKCVEDGTVYACGQEGVVLKRDNQTREWNKVPNDATTENFWAIASYDGDIYMSTQNMNGALFKTEAGKVVGVDMGLGKMSTYGLHANDGVLLSVGSADIAYTTDGKKWTRIN